MNFFDVFSEMLVILFCMAAGFLAHKLGYLGGETDQRLCRLILGITMPCLILGSVSAGDTLPSAGEILSILKVAAVYYGLGFLTAAFVPRLLGGTAKQQGVWRYCLVFANMAFIGYPVSVALFGQEALFYAVILVLPFNLLSFSLGPLMLAGHDMIAKAPTGTGKTVAFGIPILSKVDPASLKPQAVILSPTRELAQQIAQDLQNLAQFLPDIKIVCVYGGAGMDKQQRQLKAGCQIVVATPGRLMDHYRHHAIDVSDVKTVVLDEADEMLNMGFYKDVKYIIDLMKHRESLSMFSATISREVLDIGWLYQHNAAEVSVQPVEDSSPKIAQYKLLTTGRDKLADAAQIIIDEGYKRVMIFCNTKYNTGMLANQLARLNFNVDCLHGDLSQAERNRIMTRFKAGEIDVLVATDVAARGIDVSDVDAVINYDVPEENEHYTHRIGRTGRARKQGASYLFYTKEEQKRVDQLLRLTRNTDDCKSVKFDFNHEHLKIEDTAPADKFQIKAYF